MIENNTVKVKSYTVQTANRKSIINQKQPLRFTYFNLNFSEDRYEIRLCLTVWVFARVECCRGNVFGTEGHLDDGRRGHLFFLDGGALLVLLLVRLPLGRQGDWGMSVLLAVVIEEGPQAVVVLFVAKSHLVLYKADDVRQRKVLLTDAACQDVENQIRFTWNQKQTRQYSRSIVPDRNGFILETNDLQDC